jgi:hypothetical protein
MLRSNGSRFEWLKHIGYHLTHLTIKHLNDENIDILKNIISHASHLKSLQIEVGQTRWTHDKKNDTEIEWITVFPTLMQHLQYVNQLEVLHIKIDHVDQTTFVVTNEFTHIPNLKEFRLTSIYNSTKTNRKTLMNIIEHFRDMPNLVCLDISGNNLILNEMENYDCILRAHDFTALACLTQNLPYLQKLESFNMNNGLSVWLQWISKSTFQKVSTIVTLAFKSILDELVLLKNIKHVDFDQCDLDEECILYLIDRLPQFPNLQQLDIQSCEKLSTSTYRLLAQRIDQFNPLLA